MCPSEFSGMVEMKNSEAQTDDLGIQLLEETVADLQYKLEISRAKIEELDLKVVQMPSKPQLSSSEEIKKLRFDNQILMTRLGVYKKAEKGARDLCQEYEQMKIKYFNCLQENEKQKNTITEFMTAHRSNDEEIATLKIEKV